MNIRLIISFIIALVVTYIIYRIRKSFRGFPKFKHHEEAILFKKQLQQNKQLVELLPKLQRAFSSLDNWCNHVEIHGNKINWLMLKLKVKPSLKKIIKKHSLYLSYEFRRNHYPHLQKLAIKWNMKY